MAPEFVIALLAVFVSGGAVGTAGTLLAQWLVRRFDGPAASGGRLEPVDVDALRSEISDLGRHVRNLDARVDFTERLLDGALAPAPVKLTGSEPAATDVRPDGPRPSAS